MSFLSNLCSNKTTNAKSHAKAKHFFLAQSHIYGVVSAQIVASSILIAFTLWLFIRLPEPQVHVTRFVVDTIDESKASDKTLLHYNITLHNPDIYKSINYDVLILRITYSNYPSRYGATVNFDVDGKGIRQKPRETTLLANHTVNYTDPDVDWVTEELMIGLKTNKTSIYLRFIMEIRIMAFNRVIGTRQLMLGNRVYFDDVGKAFIDPLGGLVLK